MQRPGYLCHLRAKVRIRDNLLESCSILTAHRDGEQNQGVPSDMIFDHVLHGIDVVSVISFCNVRYDA